VYHLQKPIYQPTALLDHVENCVDVLATQFPEASIDRAALVISSSTRKAAMMSGAR